MNERWFSNNYSPDYQAVFGEQPNSKDSLAVAYLQLEDTEAQECYLEVDDIDFQRRRLGIPSIWD